jgi:hypothetical protein
MHGSAEREADSAVTWRGAVLWDTGVSVLLPHQQRDFVFEGAGGSLSPRYVGVPAWRSLCSASEYTTRCALSWAIVGGWRRCGPAVRPTRRHWLAACWQAAARMQASTKRCWNLGLLEVRRTLHQAGCDECETVHVGRPVWSLHLSLEAWAASLSGVASLTGVEVPIGTMAADGSTKLLVAWLRRRPLRRDGFESTLASAWMWGGGMDTDWCKRLSEGMPVCIH